MQKVDKPINILCIGSCFCGFLRAPLIKIANQYNSISSLNFQLFTTWQRIDAVVDIINDNRPDHDLVNYYIQHGYWEVNKPLGIEIHHAISTSEWFAKAILQENKKAADLVNYSPDLLIFDSLSDWRHPLYRHRKHNWKCFLGRIQFKDSALANRFEQDFEFVQLLNIKEINHCLKEIINFFKAKNNDLRTVYIHFPAMPAYLEEKWVTRAREIESEVALLQDELGKKLFHQLIIPDSKVRPITDQSHPNYSKDLWNHFEDEAYEHCAKSILEWYCGQE